MTAAAIGWRRWAHSLTVRGGLGRSMAGVGAASAGSQLLSLAVLPFVSRALPPEAFARFGLFFALAAVLGAVAALGLPEAVLAARTRRDAVSLTAAAFWSLGACGLASAALTLGLIETNAFGLQALPAWAAAAMPPVVWLIALMMLLQMWAVRTRRFETLAGAYLGQGALRAGVQAAIALAAPAVGWMALLGGEVTGRFGAVTLLTRGIPRELVLASRRPAQTWIATVRRYWRFPAFRTPSMLANNIGSALPLLLVASACSPRETGAFAFMTSLLVGPIGLAQRAVGDVFLGEFAARWRRDPQLARRLLLRTALTLGLAAAPLGAILIAFGPWLFAALFGAPWAMAGALAAAFTPAFLANLVVGPLGGALNVAGRPGFKLFVDAATIAGLLAAYAAGRGLGLGAVGLTVGFSIGSVFAYGLYLALILLAVCSPKAPAITAAGLKERAS